MARDRKRARKRAQQQTESPVEYLVIQSLESFNSELSDADLYKGASLLKLEDSAQIYSTPLFNPPESLRTRFAANDEMSTDQMIILTEASETKPLNGPENWPE